MESGEMPHQQRLAFLNEAWYSGIKSEQGLMDLFKKLHDYNEETTRYQVMYFLEHENYQNFPPYTCEKMRELRWCLESPDCPRWQRIYGEQSKKE
jgi:DNA primase large subunit